MKEIWRDIKDYEGLYQVSNLGRIRSVDRYVKHNLGGLRLYKGRIMKLQLNNLGYLTVGLNKENKSKHYQVHRLVAMTFPDLVDWTEEAKGKLFDELEINHKDENPANNRVDNLEWCTHPYNINYGTRNDKVSKTQTNRKDISKPVLQYTLDGVFLVEYPSIKEASRQTGIHFTDISACCRKYRNRTTAGGYIWKYK